MTRTRTALIRAFNQLMLGGRRNIRVADLVAEANVGRSTFYDHYSSAEDIHLEALARPFAPLAEEAAGRSDPATLTPLLDHFWQNRARARDTLTGRTGERAVRLLTDLVEGRLERDFIVPRRHAALQLAGVALTPIKGWLAAEAPCAPEALADAICRGSEAALAALRA